jgi:uncharacterized protein
MVNTTIDGNSQDSFLFSTPSEWCVMVKLALWQWGILAAPIALVLVFILVSAGYQIHEWHLSWIWAVIGLGFVGWRWLLVQWTRPALAEVEEIVAEIAAELPTTPKLSGEGSQIQQAEAALQEILAAARQDPPMWVDWNQFWQRALSLISAIAKVYNPQAKQPLLNIYIPQAYVLMRGTVDDLNEWMQKMAPVLNQVTIEQALQAYQVYQKVQPAARRMLQAWGWAQWLLNPVAAAARTATQGSRTKATQELLGNFNQIAREAVLRNLAKQSIALYSGSLDSHIELLPATPKPAETQSIKDLLTLATPVTSIETKPVNLMLVGRTGAGKSSLINSLFVEPVAKVDALPSTDLIRDYQWQTETGEALTLWDTPGYEQTGRPDFRRVVLAQASQADLVLLAMPALDPALQMDIDFLKDLQAKLPDLPTIAVVTQVDRLRPLREWHPPYDWRGGTQPKELTMREAIAYRAEVLPHIKTILPVVTAGNERATWGVDELSIALLNYLEPAKQQRLARFFSNLDARTNAAAALIDRFVFQMTTQQGITAFLKSPVLQFLSTLATGSPTLAILLAEKIPVEQLPLVIGKAQLAYELYNLLAPPVKFDLLAVWNLLIDPRGSADRNAAAFGQTLIDYWVNDRPAAALMAQFEQRLGIAE